MGSEYRPQSKDRSTFKTRNTGDGGLSQLRQRDAQVVQGMQDLRNQTEEIGRDQIAGIKRANAIELQNRADIKATVEDGSYQVKRKAIETNSRREVEALLQKGKEYGRQASMWGQLTPSMAQGFESLANSYYEQAENKQIATAHETQTHTARIFARVANEALTASELDTIASANEVYQDTKNNGLVNRITGRSPWLSIGRHDVHARREKNNIGDYWTQYANALQREGVEIDSINIGKHVDNFRAIILKSNGWVNSKSQGVIELNEVITKLKSSLTNKHINTENIQEATKQYKYAYDIVASAKPTATGIHSLVQRKRFVPDESGRLPSMAEAIEMVFVEDLAKDRKISIEDVYDALDFETPEEGRQEKYPTYGARNASLREKIRVARADVDDAERKLQDKENKYKDSVEKAKKKDWLSHTGSYDSGGENEGKGWSGDPDERQAEIDIAKQNGFTETATLLESYAPFDETQYTKGLMLDSIGELVDAGEHEQAMNLIENSPLLTNDDRNKAKAKYLPVLQHFAQAGTSEKKIEDDLESRLLINVEGTYVGNEGKTNIPSLEGAVTGGKAYLMDRFRHHDKLQADTPEGYSEALRLAWSDTQDRIDKNEGFAHVTRGSDSKTDKAYYTKYEPLVDAVAIQSDKELTSAFKSNPIIKDNDGNITSLGAWETEEILSTSYLHSIATDLNEGRPIVVPGRVLEESIKSGVPVDLLVNAQLGQTRKSGDKEGSFTQRMKPGPRDIAMEGVYPAYLNVKDRIAHAHGRLEVQNLVNFADTGGNQNLQNRDEAVNNATQFTPEQLTYIETEVQAAVKRSGKEEFIVNGNTKFKWAEIKSVCQECNLEDVDFSNVENNRYRFKPGTKSEGYILEAMVRGQLTGVYFNPVLQELIMEDD